MAWHAGAAGGGVMDKPATVAVLDRQVREAVACGAVEQADVGLTAPRCDHCRRHAGLSVRTLPHGVVAAVDVPTAAQGEEVF